MKKCKHVRSYTWSKDDGVTPEFVIACHCHACGERLSLGPSNDEPAAVQIEMRAAELPRSWRRPALMDGPTTRQGSL